MAKADIKASAKGIAGLPGRGSATLVKLDRTRATKASAERCFLANKVPAMATSRNPTTGSPGYQALTFTKAGYVCPVFEGFSSNSGNCCALIEIGRTLSSRARRRGRQNSGRSLMAGGQLDAMVRYICRLAGVDRAADQTDAQL